MPGQINRTTRSRGDILQPVITINPNRIAVFLGSIILAIIVLAVIGQIARWVYGYDAGTKFIAYFDVEAEKNPPALFAGLQLLLAATSAWLAGKLDGLIWRRRYWFILAAGFVWMSFDEVFRMHERLIEPMRKLLGDGDLGVFTYAWVIPALFVVAIVGAFYVRFLLSLPVKTSLSMLGSGALFVGGAVGLEMVGGWYWSKIGYTLTQSMIVIAEEAMEFSGICLFIFVVLKFLENEQSQGLLRIQS